MSAETFLKDYKAYFVEHELSEYDEGRILSMFNEHSKYKEIVKYKKVPMYRDRIIYVDATNIHARNAANIMGRNAEIAINSICDFWGFDIPSVFASKRTQHLVWCRYHIFLVLRGQGLSLSWIGRKFNRDHTTVIHGIQSAKNLIETQNDPFYSMYTSWCKAQGMLTVRDEEAGNGILRTQGTTEARNSDILLQPLHGV